MLHIGNQHRAGRDRRFGAGSSKSYSVTGDTVNTAQRLQSMGAPGEVLVGPLTHRLTRHAFAFESLGDVALRGKAGSVLVNRLAGPLEAPRAARGLEALGLSTPLIGRDGELTRMLNSLDLACAGSAQLVRLVGEAGLGKSRLVNEFIARLGDEERFANVACAAGRLLAARRAALRRDCRGRAQRRRDDAQRSPGRNAHQARRSADRAWPRRRGSHELDAAAVHVLGLGDPDASLQHVEPEQLRRQILYAVRTIIDRRLALSPLLIVVEDLHWADAVSLEALRFVMDRLERTRLMLVVTHRSALDDDPLESSRASHTTLRLSPSPATMGKDCWRRCLATIGADRRGISATAFSTVPAEIRCLSRRSCVA